MLPDAATSEMLKKSAFAPAASVLPRSGGLEMLPATRVSVPPVVLPPVLPPVSLLLLPLSVTLPPWQAASDKTSARDKQGRRVMGIISGGWPRHFRTLGAHRHRE